MINKIVRIINGIQIDERIKYVKENLSNTEHDKRRS